MKLLSLLFALASFIGTPARAQPVLTAHGGVIFSTATGQAVASSTGTFQMFFIRDGVEILSASSPDLGAWTLQSGVRLTTSSVATDLDASSITACGVLPSTSAATGFQRLYYVGISTAGRYTILSATATNGVTWGKEGRALIQHSGGLAFLHSPKPLALSSTLTRLYYVADSAGGNNPANYRIFSASSSDGGLTWTQEGQLLSDRAYSVSPVILTDGRVRLYYSSFSGASSTPTVVLSAISSDGKSFTKESGTSLSTTAPSGLWDLAVVRSTESFRWRMYSSYTDSVSSVPFISSATTLTPYPVSLTPVAAYKNSGPVSFTLTGEVFAPNLSIAFNQGASTITWTSVGRTTDLKATGTADPTGQSTGNWNVVVTNPDGNSGTAANLFQILLPPGSVSITDNLFRPLLGGKASINVQLFETGQVSARLYTVDGAFIRTLFDGVVAPPGTTFSWNGTNGAGATVASGLYLLHVKGPKINVTEKIVVIK